MIKNPISYPGNKNKLASQIIQLLPIENIDTIVEPFCGSAVISSNTKYKNIILNDNNKFILKILEYQKNNSFEQIVKDVESIINQYGLTYSRIKPRGTYVEYKHEGLSVYNKEGFDKLKKDFNNNFDVKKLFVLLIYGFNHYLRFNSNGEFNVPVGKVDFSRSFYEELKKFETVFNTLNIKLCNYDFLNYELYSYDNAIYYFDPPYLITTAPYNTNWNENKEKQLLKLLDDLNEKEKKFALSNVILSNGKENKILIDWARKYNIHYLKRQYRNASYQKKNITDTIEVLVTNY